MGGKTKSSQRTKNNARPSSSGRSAELLNNAAILDPSLLAGGKMMSAFFPTLATPALDHGLPPEFSLCIKKLNKKDPITKIKALQELTELVNNSKVEDVVSVLPSWAHFYRILSVDTDCKVREMAQMCHGAITGLCGRQTAPLLRQLVPAWLQAQHDEHAPAAAHAARLLTGNITSSCGRQTAPLLRQLVPAWLQAQHDEHAPAAAHAAASLQKLFPENKLPEVISYCKAEVTAHLIDSLIGNAQKTLIKPAEEASERALQLQRLATSSLQGLQYLARRLPGAHGGWLWAELAPLLAAPAYWHLAPHADQHLRSAWFAAMARIVERFASTFAEQYGARLLKVVLAAAHDTQPLPAQQIWGCLLQFMYSVPDWHKYLDKKDLLTKRILNMLEKGGWGEAKRMTDMLLPLLAHLPQDMVTKEFYEEFFNSFFKGLEKKSILSSKSERQHWISSLAECLRYLSIQQNDFVIEVTTSVHRNWLKIVLSTEREGQLKTNLIKHSATSMVALVKYWLKQSREANGEKYDQLIRNFWQNVCSTVLAQIDKPEGADIAKIVEAHILLLQTLKQAFLSETKKVQSIKFDGDIPNETEVKPPTQEIDTSSLEKYNHNLNETVEKICCNYFEYADKNDLSEPILMPLISILNEFDNKNLYLALARHFSATGVHDFYEKVLMKWMLTDTMRSKTIVDIVFILMKHLSDQEQETVMNSFDKLGCGVVEWCLGAALCHSAWRVAAARRWLRSAAVTAALLSITRRLLKQRCANARNLLLVCLSTDDSGEMLISEETASQIANVVSEALSDWLDSGPSSGEQLEVEHVSWVAAHLCTALATRRRADSGATLVTQLFRLVVRLPVSGERLEVEHVSWVAAHLCTALATRRRADSGATLVTQLFRLVVRLPVSGERLEVEHVSWVAAHLCTALATRRRADSGATLVTQLFRLVARLPRGDPSLSVGGWAEASSAAHDGLAALAPAARAPAAALIVDRLQALVEEVNVPQIEHITSLCPYLLSGCSSQDDVTEVVQLTHLLLNYKLDASVEIPALRHDCVVGRLNCPFDDDNDIIKAVVRDANNDNPIELTKTNLIPNINKILFRAMFLKTILLRANTDEDEEKSEDSSWCNMVLSDEFVQKQFCELLRECMIVNSLDEAYGFWLHHDIIKEAKTKLYSIVDDIVAATVEKTRMDILDHLLEFAAEDGYYWACARRFYEVKVEGGAANACDLDSNPYNVDNIDYHTTDNLEGTMDESSEDKSATSPDNKEEAKLDDLKKDFINKCVIDNDDEEMQMLVNGKGYYHCVQANTQWSDDSEARLRYLYAVAIRSVVAGIPAADKAFEHTAVEHAMELSLDPFVDLYHRLDPNMLGERDILSMPWGEVVAEVAIIDLVTGVLHKTGWDAPSHHWDFATVTLCALVGNLAKAGKHCNTTKVAMVARATFRLYLLVQDFIAKIPARCLRQQPSPHVAELMNEWKDVFACTLHRDLYALAVTLLREPPKTITYNLSRVLTGLSRAIRVADWALIDSAHKNSSLQLQVLASACGAALAQPLAPPLHCVAYSVLCALTAPLADYDEEKISSWCVEGPDASQERPPLSLDWLHPHFNSALELTDAALSAFTPGIEACAMDPSADSHGVALGCLLLGAALHRTCARASHQLSHHYMHMFRDARYVETLLPVSLRLIPAQLLAAASAPGSAALPDQYRHMFHSTPALDASDPRWRGAVGWLACYAVMCCVSGAGGGAARGWWGAAGRGARPLARLVHSYVTAPLVRRHLRTLALPHKLQDVEIRILWSAHEVVAEYTVEERRVELWVKFGPEYPLTLPQVTAPCARPAVNVAWVPMYIAYQNGTVLNAIKMWTEAISSHVEASPQCYICYFRLHPSTGHLPSVPCHQCRNRFHTPCLHKWFASSHRTNCPLCRATF